MSQSHISRACHGPASSRKATKLTSPTARIITSAMTPRIAIPTPTSTDLDYNRRNFPAYLAAIEQAGGTPVEFPLAASRTEQQALAATCAGILLPGSPADIDPLRYGQPPDPATAPADPAREATDILLLEDAATHHKPILGICFGLQSINTWRGGTLHQDLSILPVNHPAGPSIAIAHTAAIAPDSCLASLLCSSEAPFLDQHPRLPINSSHHQAIATLGDGLRITARCPQDAVIEAIEAEPASGLNLLAVQWHPERSTASSATSRALFTHLVRQASR